MQPSRVELALGANKLILETGKLAKQAHGAVLVQYGDTVILAAATAGPQRRQRLPIPAHRVHRGARPFTRTTRTSAG